MLHRRADQFLIERIQQIRRGLTGTPLITLANEQCDLVAKLEFCNPTGSSKDRSALWILEQAIGRGEIAHDTTVVESSSGNFALALAFYCRMLGIPFVPVIDPNCNEATETQLRLLCERVEKVCLRDTAGSYLKTRLSRVQELLAELDSAYWPNQYANPDARDAHYRFTAGELIAQAGPLDYLFVGVGTGGTIAGLSHRIKETYPGCVVVAVDAEGSVIFGGPPKKRRIPGIGSSIVPPLCGQALIDHVEIVPETRAVEACAALATTYGLYAGGSTGSTYAAVQDYFAQHPPGPHRPRVAFIAADRGHAYAQTIHDPTWARQLHAQTLQPPGIETLAVN
ncbi:2,3-diaminopropionate biosynthesis protein SbnA [Streptomyces fodineus]|uniref:2,3-diaminopropionate biosynthesis protein SbnA n=1 Tax=Streptomyces fodineus TaxID=1904616 RepID=A0A1D7YJK0_9ACTN|nr:2,3-diaminopropionate biosynthesis protein SbnA [Streptomyces fodineus]AOR35731.1 2,3-diaminopropionate biosynthesis protein SbnA [Streptomyces fodineus]AOR35738.1 2,3-diaminopropionate biosynthesis protein SbnA [Streptomyces fodineus]